MRSTDLVLEGGGVKGAGLAGAVAGLAEEYSFHRVAGTSAGAIVASFVAAGLGKQLEQIMLDTDFSAFEDAGIGGRWLGWLGTGLDLVLHEGIYKGEALHRWISDVLAGAGVRTWGDLRIDHDPSTPVEHRYSLVVIVSDVSRGRMLRLPWDYEELLGVDPDQLPVADAVRASASIPFFFRPWRLPVDPGLVGGREQLVLTDGGMLSNYPIAIFDDDAERPTIGVRLSARLGPAEAPWMDPDDPVSLVRALVGTMCNAHDQVHIDQPSVVARTIFVDTHGVSSTDFGIPFPTKARLFDNGLHAAATFMCDWDYDEWRCRYADELGHTLA